MIHQPRYRRYTDEELISMWRNVAIKMKKQKNRLPIVTEFEELGLPRIDYFNRAFGNYSNFKTKAGVKNVKPVNYKKKDNPKRYFNPREWISFLNIINN